MDVLGSPEPLLKRGVPEAVGHLKVEKLLIVGLVGDKMRWQGDSAQWRLLSVNGVVCLGFWGERLWVSSSSFVLDVNVLNIVEQKR